ncbi:hypothetical protein HanRHA438_Chr04g0195861 [Helianthus annuus]|nr:hypothetical protein HanRHA438_Chr04g0195861 [Helianthus annuus]
MQSTIHHFFSLVHKTYKCVINMRYKIVKQVVFMFNTCVIRVVRNQLNLIRHDLSALFFVLM